MAVGSWDLKGGSSQDDRNGHFIHREVSLECLGSCSNNCLKKKSNISRFGWLRTQAVIQL